MITIVFPQEHKKWFASNHLLFKHKQRRMWWCSTRVFWFLNDWGAIRLNLQTSRYFTNVQPLPWVDGKWRISYTFLRLLLLLLLLFLGFKEISPSSTNCGNLNWIIISWCYYWISRQEKCKRDFFCSCYADQYLHRMEALCAHGSIKKFQGSKEGMCLQ